MCAEAKAVFPASWNDIIPSTSFLPKGIYNFHFKFLLLCGT